MNQPVHVGDAHLARTGLFAVLPPKAIGGESLRAISVMAEASAPSNADFWIIRIGRADGTRFETLREASFSSGFPPHPVRIDFGSGIPVSPGDVLLWMVVPQGAPEPLAGLSIAPEWGTLGARR